MAEVVAAERAYAVSGHGFWVNRYWAMREHRLGTPHGAIVYGRRSATDDRRGGSDVVAVSPGIGVTRECRFRPSRSTRRGFTSGKRCLRPGSHLSGFALSSRSNWSRSRTRSSSIAPSCTATVTAARCWPSPVRADLAGAGRLRPRMPLGLRVHPPCNPRPLQRSTFPLPLTSTSVTRYAWGSS